MKKALNRLVPLVPGMILLAGCAGAPNAQDANTAKAQTTASAPATVAKAPEQPAAPAKLDHYTVVNGDTLSKIAARPEVYGDMDLWPLLYQGNVSQIKPGGLIYPGQVLNINRNYTEADIKQLKSHRHARSKIARQGNGPNQPVAPNFKGKPNDTSGTAYLDAARNAFEAGDIEWTLSYYSTYLKSHQKDADAWGELGNVYLSQGMTTEAAQSYYNSANILIDQGEIARAQEILPAIEDGAPELAKRIYKRLPYL